MSQGINSGNACITRDRLSRNPLNLRQLTTQLWLIFQLQIKPILSPRRRPLILLSLSRDLCTYAVNEGANPELSKEFLPINLNLLRLGMHMVNTNEAVQIQLHSLRLATLDTNTHLNEAQRIKLMKEQVKLLQGTNNERMRGPL
jgi:hypothetical protein